MVNISKKINSIEKLYYERNKYKALWVLLQKLYILYKLYDDKDILLKANNLAVSEIKHNKSDFNLIFYIILFDIEFERFDLADYKLNYINRFKKYFKSNNPVFYAVIIYLNAILKIKVNTLNSSDKLFNEISEYNDYYNNGFIFLLTADLSVKLNKPFNLSQKYFYLSYNNGNRSGFFYLSLFNFFYQKPEHKTDFNKLLIPLFNWGMTHKVDLTKIIEKYQDNVTLNFFDNNLIGIRLYKKYPNEWILKELCRMLMMDLDYSKTAFDFYHEATVRQIELPYLNEFFIKSAFKTGFENISVYPIKKFLENEDVTTEIKPFIYHIILSNKKYRFIADEYKENILEFGIFSINSQYQGRFYNSIYKFMLDNEDDVSEIFIDAAEELLYNQLFMFEAGIEDTRASKIWVKEKEKNNMNLFSFNNCVALVSSAVENFSYYIFDESQKNILNLDIKINKLVDNADIKLYQRFYFKGYRSDNLFIVLSKYYMNIDEPSKNGINILKETLKLKIISRAFKMKISAALGNVYYKRNNLSESYKYYKAVDINLISDKNIENLIDLFIQFKEFKKAVDLISRKGYLIADRKLYNYVRQISEADINSQKLIANICYELLMKSWYNALFVDIILEYYNGSQKEWQELSNTLVSISIFDRRIDEKIINNAIWLHLLDINSQKSFCRLYANRCRNEIIDKFVEYCCYEIIVNYYEIQLDIIKILEDLYLKTYSDIIGYALATAYINQNIATLKSDNVIQNILETSEANNIFIPLFKTSKDKRFLCPYIEKNKAFIYKANPNKKVLLHFRFDKKSDFIVKKMKYFKFGLYLYTAAVFFGETFEYFISEEMASGSIETKRTELVNDNVFIYNEYEDDFYEINNAFIYDSMFKYDIVEDIVCSRLEEHKKIKGRLL